MTDVSVEHAAAAARAEMLNALGPEYALVVEARRAQERQRKRNARQRQTIVPLVVV